MSKTFICIITLTMLLCGCALYPDTSMYDNFIPFSGLTIDWSGWSLFMPNSSNLEIIAFIVTHEVTYLEDKNGEYWQTPEETWLLRTGDCEDKVILFMGLLAENGLLNNHTMLAVRLSDKSYHAVVYDPNTQKVYELSNGTTHNKNEYNVVHEYNYGQVMYQAYEHTRLDWF